MPSAATPLVKLKNLGAKSQAWLRDVGLHTRADLEALGPVLAYKIVKHHHPEATLLLLYALYGALHDRHWASLTDEEKFHLAEEAAAPLTVTPGRGSAT